MRQGKELGATDVCEKVTEDRGLMHLEGGEGLPRGGALAKTNYTKYTIELIYVKRNRCCVWLHLGERACLFDGIATLPLGVDY